MLSGYGRNEWLTILAIGGLFTVTTIVVGWWPVAILVVVVTFAILTFFRDPERRVPTQRGIVVAPADGRVSSIHELEHYEPLEGPAVCIRIFLSVLDVHVNRSPCHGTVLSITHKSGDHLNAMNPDSAESNESNLIVWFTPSVATPWPPCAKWPGFWRGRSSAASKRSRCSNAARRSA